MADEAAAGGDGDGTVVRVNIDDEIVRDEVLKVARGDGTGVHGAAVDGFGVGEDHDHLVGPEREGAFDGLRHMNLVRPLLCADKESVQCVNDGIAASLADGVAGRKKDKHVAIAGLAVFIVREFSVEHPILDLRLFGQRNVGMTQLVMFMVGLSLYSSTVLIPQFLQEIMGYSARQAGMAVSSGGLVLMALFPVAGALAPKFDPRKLVSVGFVITTFGLWRMTDIDLNVSFALAVSWRAVIALGLPFLFIPINTLCYAGIPQEKYNEVSGLTALMRNLGGSVGISCVTTLLARQSQKHLAMLATDAAPGNPPFERMRSALAGAWQHIGNAKPDAMNHAGAQIFGMAQIQARLLAYVDVIWIMVAITAVLIPLPFVMRRPRKLGPPPAAH